jgi:hypothetical protein
VVLAVPGLFVLVGCQAAESFLDTAGVVPAVDVAQQGGLGLGDVAVTYAINARLLTDEGTELVETQQTTTFDPGTNSFTLDFEWNGIRDAGIDGPYKVADLSIYPTFDTDGLGYLITAHITDAYPAPAHPAQKPGL